MKKAIRICLVVGVLSVLGFSCQAGTLLTSPTWTASSEDSRDVAWGDWDNDGDLDLAVGNYGGPIRVYENDGLGTATSLTLVWSSTETDDTTSIAWGDWDCDGDLDLAVGNYDQVNRVYENDGLGTATSLALAWSSTETDATSSVAWGDWDGDGNLDLAVGNGSLFTVQVDRVYQNDGWGNSDSLTLAWTSPETYATTGVAWGDWDGDGDLDLAVAHNLPGSDGPRIYRNSGGPSLTLTWSYAISGLSTVNWLDWDGDGDMDLAAGVGTDTVVGPVRVFENGGGDPPVMTLVGSTGTSRRIWNRMSWGDWDGDGILELALGSAYSPYACEVYENDGLGNANSLSSAWSVAATNEPYSAAWGDWDNDGDLDLAVAFQNAPAASARVYENVGPSFADASAWSSTETETARGLAWGDWDGDGDLDLAVGNYGQSNRVYQNNGGALSSAWSSTEPDNSNSVAWGDWDGDGDLDLAVGNNGVNRVYGNGGGILSLLWSSVEMDDTRSVSWADWDLDQDLDLAVGNYGAPTRVYENDGLGTATSLTLSWSSTETDDTTGIAWGDWDGDGDMDLAVGNYGQAGRVYRNDGGSFILAWSSAEADSTTSVAWGDWNGDGDMDLAVGNNGVNRVYENDGLGNGDSLALVWSSPETDDTTGIAWPDVDGDGDLDLSVINDGTPNRIYINDGLGTFTSLVLGWSASVTETASCGAWGDVDADGDLDWAAATSGITEPVRLYKNGCITRPGGLTETPVHAVIMPRPGLTDGADFFSSSDLLLSPVTIPYRLYDEQGDRCWKIVPEYSPDGGGRWLPAAPGAGGDGLTDLAAGPSGTSYTFSWDSDADACDSDNVRFRITVLWQAPNHTAYPIQRGAIAAVSLPFRVFHDSDGDGLRDINDACPQDQENDLDGDGICGDVDNCPHNANPTQGLALSLGDRVWLDSDADGIQDPGEPGFANVLVALYDSIGRFSQATVTDGSGHYQFTAPCPGPSRLDVYLPGGYSFSPRDQGSDDALDSDIDPATGRVAFSLSIGEARADLDCGLVSGCSGPDETIFIYLVTDTGNPYYFPVINFMDPNQPAQVTGYNIRREDDIVAHPDLATWDVIGSNVIDMDEGTPNKQWIDSSGDEPCCGIWYYQVTAYSSVCAAEGPF